MSGSIIELVEASFGTDLRASADALRAGKADDCLTLLYQAWPDWASGWQSPPLPLGQLRPFACANWAGHDAGGLASAWMELAGRPAHRGLERHIVQHLLFCDSVALPDPFVQSPDGDILIPRIVGGIRDRQSLRARVATAIDWIARLEHLIDDNVVVVAPAPLKPRGLDRAAAQAVDQSLADQFPPKPADYWGMGEEQIVAMDIALQLSSAGGAMDPYLPTAGHVSVFRDLMRSADETIRGATQAAKPGRFNAILPRVLPADLPEPLDVSLADVAAIRRNGEFDGWREAVARGVQTYVERVGDDGECDSAELLRLEIGEEVIREAERVRASLSGSKNRAVEVGFDFAVVGGAVAAPFLGPLVGAGVGALGGAKLLAVQLARWRFARGAFARHVALFTDHD